MSRWLEEIWVIGPMLKQPMRMTRRELELRPHLGLRELNKGEIDEHEKKEKEKEIFVNKHEDTNQEKEQSNEYKRCCREGIIRFLK